MFALPFGHNSTHLPVLTQLLVHWSALTLSHFSLQTQSAARIILNIYYRKFKCVFVDSSLKYASHFLVCMLCLNFFFPVTSVTETQSGWGWKWPLEIIWSNPLLRQVSMTMSRQTLEHLWRWMLHNYLGNICQCSITFTIFPDIQRKPSILQFVCTTSCTVITCHWKEPGSIFSAPSFHGSDHLKPSLL